MINNNAKMTASSSGPGTPKAASPLQREIGLLAETTSCQEKIIEELFDKLRPVFQQIAESQPANQMGTTEQALSEVPQSVKNWRERLEGHNNRLNWLIAALEV